MAISLSNLTLKRKTANFFCKGLSTFKVLAMFPSTVCANGYCSNRPLNFNSRHKHGMEKEYVCIHDLLR